MRLSLLALFLSSLLIVATHAKIRQLTASNLEQFAKDNSYWLIQITNGKCSECKQHEAQLEQISNIMDGAIKVGKIDAKLIPNLKIPKNPTYMFTRSDQPQNSKPFEGKFGRAQIVPFCLKSLSEFMKQRQGPSSGGSSKQGQSQSSSSGKQEKSSSQSGRSSGSVIELTDSTFESKVLKSNDAWLVQFYSPGCGHCKNFEPEYSKLPKLIGKRVHISRLDGTKHQQHMGKYQVKGFPTVLLFESGSKGEPVTYQGERTAQAVVDWLKTHKINEEKKELLELTKQNYQQECNRNIVCLIFILNRKADKSKLSFLKEVMAEQAERPFRFFYSERLPRWEEQLMIADRDCPKMVSVWDSINSYRIYNGQVNYDDITSFLKNALQRRRWIKSDTKISQTLFAPSSEEL